MHQIGEVAERVDLSLRTVRYYEEQGLISPETRTSGGFRLYTDKNIKRLLMIKQMKPLGFSLDEMREVLAARDVLELPGSSNEERMEARETLSRFAQLSGERCEKMAGHLAAGKELTKQLSREGGRGPRLGARD